MKFRPLFAVAVLVVSEVPKADDVEEAKKRLTIATTAHQAEEEKFRRAVGEHLDELELRAQKKGDNKTLEQIRNQQKAFKTKNEVPLSFPAALKKKYSDARLMLEKAFDAAARSLLKAGQEDEVKAVDRQRKEFHDNGYRRLTAVLGRPIVTGTVVKGSFRSWRPTKKGEANVARSEWKLVVLNANESSFAGTWEWDGGSAVQAVDGKLGPKGFISLRFVKNIKGNDEAVQGGGFVGTVTDAGKLEAKYERRSANRVGEVLGEIVQFE